MMLGRAEVPKALQQHVCMRGKEYFDVFCPCGCGMALSHWPGLSAASASFTTVRS